MHVQFEFTQDDFVDAQKRFWARWKVARSFQWRGMLYTACFAGLLVFLLFYRTPTIGAILALAAALLSAVFYPGSSRRAFEKRWRLVSREILGDGSSFLCEVEIRPEGVWVRQGNRQILHEWLSVEEIKETSDSVDIFTKDKSGVVVRNQAFSSPEERLRFIELTRAGVNSILYKPPSDVKPI